MLIESWIILSFRKDDTYRTQMTLNRAQIITEKGKDKGGGEKGKYGRISNSKLSF